MPNMYSIYIKNFWRQGSSGSKTYIQTRELVYSVPISDPEKAFVEPVVKCEMGKAGSFEFTVYPNNPYFNAWRQMKTLMYVEYDGTTIFHGRVLTVNDNPFNGSRKIHCEGDLAFLLDSIQPMSKEEDRPTITLADYIRQILGAHNQQMFEAPTQDTDAQGIGTAVNTNSDPEMEKTDKVIQVGEVPNEYSGSIQSAQRIANASEKFGSKDWESTLNALEDLTKRYGGYFRTRYSTYTAAGREWDICYLDWLENYFRNNDSDAASIEVAKNLIDLSTSTEVDNIFTVLVPIGSKEGKELFLTGYQYRSGATWNKKYITVPDIVRLYREGVIPQSKLTVGYHSVDDYESSISDYGYIYKPQKFENADTQAKLFEYAVDWIANNYIGGVTNFTISALDLHHYNPSIYANKYLVGDRIKVLYPDPNRTLSNPTARVSKILTVLGIEYNLHNPEKNAYTIGTPNQILTRTYGASNKKTKTNTSVGTKTKEEKEKEKIQNEVGKIDETLWTTVMSNYYNRDQYSELDPTQTSTILKAQYLFLKHANDRPKGSAGLLLDGLTGKISFDADNPRDEKMALKKMEMYGDNLKYIRHLIEDEKIVSTIGFSVNSNGLMQGSQMLLGENAEGEKVAINIDGLDGLMSMFGIDGTSGETFKSIDMSGFQNFLKFFKKPETPEEKEAGQGKESGEVDGEEGSAGFGGKETDPDTHDTNWKINIGKKLRYKGSDGQIHETETEIVSAKDFYLADVPSFKAEFAYIDTVVVKDLYAAKGKIDNLTTETLGTQNIFVNQCLASTSMTAPHLYISESNTDVSGEGTARDLLRSIKTATFKEGTYNPDTERYDTTTGKITLELMDWTSKVTSRPSFNMASTTFYKNEVEAAWNNGGKTAYLKYNGSTSLDPGGSVEIFAYYKDYAGTAECTPTGSPNYVKITAKDTRAANWNSGGQTAYATVSKASLNPGESSVVTVYYTAYNGTAASTSRTYTISANSGGGGDFTGDDITLIGYGPDSGVSSTKPSDNTYKITKNGLNVSGYIWGKLSDGNWHRLRAFTISHPTPGTIGTSSSSTGTSLGAKTVAKGNYLTFKVGDQTYSVQIT